MDDFKNSAVIMQYFTRFLRVLRIKLNIFFAPINLCATYNMYVNFKEENKSYKWLMSTNGTHVFQMNGMGKRDR